MPFGWKGSGAAGATQKWVAVTNIKRDESRGEFEGIKLMGYAAAHVLSFLSFLLVISATDNYQLPSVIIFLYQSVITMLQIKKLAANLKWNSVGKRLFTVLVVVSLRWPLTLPKARCACQRKRITGLVPAWAFISWLSFFAVEQLRWGGLSQTWPLHYWHH